MPNLSLIELITILLVLTVLVGGIYLIVQVIRWAWGGGHTTRIQELEARVRDLEQGR